MPADWNEVDPITQIYCALSNAIAQDRGIIERFGVLGTNFGNLPDITDVNFQDFKSEMTDSDSPYLMLTTARFLLKPFGSNSKIAEFSQTFRLTSNAENLQLVQPNFLKMRMMVLLFKLGAFLGLDGLVKDFRVEDCEDEMKNALGSRRVVSVLDIVVHAYVPCDYLASLQ